MITLLLLVLAVSASAVQVTIPGVGTVRGVTGRTAWTNRIIYKFHSIKFGEAERFGVPRFAKPWDDVYDASEPRTECPQLSIMEKIRNSDPNIDWEDCLTLNVFTPKIPDEKNKTLLPVFIHIYGGAFVEGSSHFFPPDYFLEHDVLHVIPNYRVIIFGFLCLHTDAIPGNMGMMDQVLAMEWVNKHIEHFGGDPNRVTLFGHSSGATSIALHLVSEAVRPELFHQVILQSGAAYSDYYLNTKPIEMTMKFYKGLTGRSTNNITLIEETLKNVTTIELLDAVGRTMGNIVRKIHSMGRLVYQQAGSMKYLTKHPDVTRKAGKHKKVPMMLGVTRHDGSFITQDYYEQLEENGVIFDEIYLRTQVVNDFFQGKVRALVDVQDTTGSFEDFLSRYFFKEVYDRPGPLIFADLERSISDLFGFIHLKGQIFKQAKLNVIDKQPTYLYTFDYKGEHTRFGFDLNVDMIVHDPGVTHADEMLYMFPYPYNTTLNKADTKIAKLTVDLWTSFAINGKPTSDRMDIEWPPLELAKYGPYIHINKKCYLGYDFVTDEYRRCLEDAGMIDVSHDGDLFDRHGGYLGDDDDDADD